MEMKNEMIFYGEWFIPETKENLSGELHINEEEKYIFLVLTRLCDEENPITNIKAKGVIDIIKGKLSTGGSILLYNCHFQGAHTVLFQKTQVVANVEYAFWNLDRCNSSEELRFSKVSVDFGEILEWSGLCAFNSKLKKKKISFEWDSKPKIELVIDEKKSLIIVPSFGAVSTLIRTKEIKFSQKIDIQFIYQSPEALSNILKDIQTFKNLLSLGMQRSIFIDEIEYYHESNRLEEYPEIIQKMKVFCGSGNAGHHKGGDWTEFLFTLNDLTVDNKKCLSMWFEKYKRLKPVVELSTSVFNYVDISKEMLFLNLVQGLETYHTRFISDNIKEYYHFVDEMLMKKYHVSSFDKLPEEALDDRAFLITERDAKKAKRILLRSRLGYLFYSKSKTWRVFLGYSREEFVNKVVDTRNYLTHYNENKEEKIFSEQEFLYANSLLMLYLQYYVLIEIGIKKKKAKKLLHKGLCEIYDEFYENQ